MRISTLGEGRTRGLKIGDRSEARSRIRCRKQTTNPLLPVNVLRITTDMAKRWEGVMGFFASDIVRLIF